jgi:hypothetical protein
MIPSEFEKLVEQARRRGRARGGREQDGLGAMGAPIKPPSPLDLGPELGAKG